MTPRSQLRLLPGLACAGFLCFGLATCGGGEESAPPSDEATPPPPAEAPVRLLDAETLEGFQPLPEPTPGDASLVELGRKWFLSTDLSVDGSTSCASCHDLERGGDDGLARSTGPGGSVASRNAPSLWNVATFATYGWDGRSNDLESFLASHLLDAWATGFADEEQLARATENEFDLVVGGLATYLRTLIRPSRWDRFLNGDDTALTADEQRGFQAFVNASCTMCHAGTSFGGDDFQTLGMVEDWPDLEDPGRAAVTGDDADAGTFRTAPLRGITATGPYGHAGQVESLEEMVRLMAVHQVGLELDEEQVASIVAWLHTLD